MSTTDHQQPAAQSDTLTTILEFAAAATAFVAVLAIAAPILIPVTASRIAGEVPATKARFWVVWRWQWVINVLGVLLVVLLLTAEAALLNSWIIANHTAIVQEPHWPLHIISMGWPWILLNIAAGILLLPLAWSVQRRRIAQLVRNRRISDVMRQTRIETARKRAADLSAARRIGVKVDAQTGRITGTKRDITTAPLKTTSGRQAFGAVHRLTVQTLADRFYDTRTVRDWIDADGRHLVLPDSASSVRALLIAESGTGKTVVLNDLMLCALEYRWPIFFLDAKGDPADAQTLADIVRERGRTATIGGPWNLFDGNTDQVTAKLMRLMPPPDGANQHYLDEIRGILQAVQHHRPLSSVDDLRERLTKPVDHVRDQFDLKMVKMPVDRNNTTAGERTLQSLLVALRPLERWLSPAGWSYNNPHADVTIVPLSPVDDAQARLGDLLLIDLRNYLATRLARADKTPVLVVVDEFAQLVTGSSDPGDTAGSLFETARSAGMGLILAVQSPAGLSNDEIRRRRALSSGAALMFGRSKDPEDVVKYAGTVMQMEASGAATGEELKSARAQHTYVIPPQDVREAADGAFWLIQAGAIAPFRALPNPQSTQPKATPHGE